MSLTAAQVEEAIESQDDFYWGQFDWNPEKVEPLMVDGVEYEFEILDSKFGREGMWHAELSIVFRVGSQTFKKTGYYASHDGEYWDGPITEVVGVPTEVIVWEDK